MAGSKIAPHSISCAVVLATGAFACGGSAGVPAASVRDSAGIQIVESPAPQWADGEGWTLSAEPILEIGVMDGDDPYMLDRVLGVVRFEDGLLVVANAGDGTLRYFDSTGTHLYTAGGMGEGPAEFTSIFRFGRLGDNVAAHQYARLPSKVFDRQGNLLRAMVPPNVGFAASPLGAFDDGSLFMVTWPQGRTIRGDVYLDSAHLIRTSLDFSTADTVALLPAVHFVVIQLAIAQQGVPQQYGPRQATVMRDTDWYFGWPQDYEFREYSKDGTLRRIIRRSWDPIPVTSDDVQRYRDETMGVGMERSGEVPPRLLAQRQLIVDGMVYPEYHPAFDRIDVDRVGNVWVERNDPANPRRETYTSMRDAPARWDVFDPDGVWLGAVEFPARFWAWEIGEGYVAGVWKDDVDVERVKVYELVKPS